MGRYIFTLFRMILILWVSGGITGCSSEEPTDGNENIQLKMAEIENAVSLKQFKTIPSSMEIVNISYFDKATDLKNATSDLERREIKAELSDYDISYTKSYSQKKNDKQQLTEKEKIICESLLSSLSNSEECAIAICEFYINEISCMNLDDHVKMDIIDRITFLKDLMIFIDYETNTKMVSYDVVDEEKPFDDCFDNCMNDEIRHATSSTIREVLFLMHLPLRVAEFIIICVGDCV